MESLLQKSRKNNSSIEVTGLLISYQGLFIQYLEGEDATVDDLYEKIRTDPRHRSVIEISSDWKIASSATGPWPITKWMQTKQKRSWDTGT